MRVGAKEHSATRKKLLGRINAVGREHSDATVLFQASVAACLNLHPTDYKVLAIIERLGALSAGDIARHSGLATASVTNLIDRLEEKGFVQRLEDSRDRRRVLVATVAERVDSVRGLFASTRQSLSRLYQRYSDAELRVIADFLSRNAARLRVETGKVTARPTAWAEESAVGTSAPKRSQSLESRSRPERRPARSNRA
jgi:DNA-binding MarR family transcriptional regulator